MMAVSERLKICVSEVKEFDKQYGIYEKEDAPTLSNLIYNALCLAGEDPHAPPVLYPPPPAADPPPPADTSHPPPADPATPRPKRRLIGQIDIAKAVET